MLKGKDKSKDESYVKHGIVYIPVFLHGLYVLF